MNQIDGNAIVFLATAWGPAEGGINALNTDFCSAVAQELSSQYEVICFVSSATTQQIEDARSKRVSLREAGSGTDVSIDIQKVLSALSPDELVELWIGHDIVTGEFALKCKERHDRGRVAILSHMSYISYYSRKHAGSGAETISRHTKQREVFGKADMVFGVGPKLHQAASDLHPTGPVFELIPGLAEVDPLSNLPTRLSCITFGRLEQSNDAVKQIRLAVAGFSRAIKAFSAMPDFSHDPTILLVGADGAQDTEMRQLAYEQAGRNVNVITHPYIEQRDQLFSLLRTQSACMMLSLHDGFGLAGWEAIAAEVPLILSKNTGLYQFIDSALGGAGTGCLRGVDIKGTPDGTFHEDDIAAISSSLVEIVIRKTETKRDARSLKSQLVRTYTWAHAAKRFLRDCGLATQTATSAEVADREKSLSASRVAMPSASRRAGAGGGHSAVDARLSSPSLPLGLNRAVVLGKCDYFSDVQLWPLRSRLDPEAWLSNFLPQEMEYALHLLYAFQYFSEQLTTELFDSAFQSLSSLIWEPDPDRHHDAWGDFLDSVLLTAVSRNTTTASADNHHLLRRAATLVGPDHVFSLSQALRKALGHPSKPVVIVDDFVGSGGQFVELWFRSIETEHGRMSSFDEFVNTHGGRVYFCPLMCTQVGQQRIERTCVGVTMEAAHILGVRDSALTKESCIWPKHLIDAAPEVIRQASLRAGIPEFSADGNVGWKGDHDLGLTIAFAESIPPGTLPIFAWKSDNWRPLIHLR